MITKLEPGAIEQRCGVCQAKRMISREDLRRGMGANPNAIALPPCTCGAFEVLLVTGDRCPPEREGTIFDLHRRVVNSIGHTLAGNYAVEPYSEALVGDPPDRPTASNLLTFNAFAGDQ